MKMFFYMSNFETTMFRFILITSMIEDAQSRLCTDRICQLDHGIPYEKQIDHKTSIKKTVDRNVIIISFKCAFAQ